MSESNMYNGVAVWVQSASQTMQASLCWAAGECRGLWVKPLHNWMVILGRFGWEAMGGVNQKKDDQLYLKKIGWVSGNKGRNWLTSGMCWSQSLASILSCVRLSESPTSKAMLGRRDRAGRTVASACFFLDPSWKTGGRKVNPDSNYVFYQTYLLIRCPCILEALKYVVVGSIAQEQGKGRWSSRHGPPHGLDLACT